jgi:hypothetical protein
MKHSSLMTFIPLALLFAVPSQSQALTRDQRMEREMNCIGQQAKVGHDVDWQDICYSSPLADHNSKVTQALDSVESLGSSPSSNPTPAPSAKRPETAPAKRRVVSPNTNIQEASWGGSTTVSQEVNNFIKHKVHQMEMGTEISHIVYKEPIFSLKSKGEMFGVYAVYTYRPGKDDIFENQFVTMYRLDTKLSIGEMEYSSEPSGTAKGFQDYMFETRAIVGYDWNTAPDWQLTPYVGVGYRRLSDSGSGIISSAGGHFYDRIANYWYFPLGIDVTHQLNKEWRIQANGEFDSLFWGNQETKLSDVSPGLSDVNNDQHRGMGLRTSIKIQRMGEKYDFHIEPFVRYWELADSDVVYMTPVDPVYEPKNNSTEIGVKAGIQF